MSGTLLYCILPPGQEPPPPGLSGVDGSPVEAVEAGGLMLWVSPLEASPPPTLERVRSHNAVAQAAAERDVTPLPLRYGQWLERDGIDEWLRPRAAGFARLLDELAGTLEFGVRVLDPEASGTERPAATGGREYMEALVERERGRRRRDERGEAVLKRLREALGELVRREAVEPPTSPRTVVTVAHAVARRDFGMYRARVEALRPEWPSLRLLVSGPWPPYSFVE